MEKFEKSQNISHRSVSPIIICDFHNEPIFNFCINLECLKPLCPDCINEHQEYHDEKETKADFSTIKAVKLSCNKKIEAGMTSLTQEVKKCELEYLLDPEALIENGIRKIRKFKERVTYMIEGHCSYLEETLKRRVQENLLKGSDFEGIFEEMKNIINEMEYLRKNLDSSAGISYIKKICMLDLKALMTNFRGKVQKVIETKDFEPIDIHVDENRFKQFKNDLENMLFIKKENKKLNFSQVEELEPEEFNQKNKPSANNSMSQEQSHLKNHKKSDQPGEETSHWKPNNPYFSPIQDLEKKNESKIKFKIEIMDYFLPEAMKNLHFFQKNAKILNILDLNTLDFNQNNVRFKKFHLNAKEIPSFTKTVSLPDGNIYLIGGELDNGEKSHDINYFSEKELNLKRVGRLAYARSLHGLCVNDSYVYIIGGYGTKGLLPICERFNILTKECEPIKDHLKFPAANPALCNFRYSIFKFGGIDQKQVLIQEIEKFDMSTEKWENIYWEKPNDFYTGFKFLMNSACVQINSSDILIVGGYDEAERSHNQCLLFNYDKRSPHQGSVSTMPELALPTSNGLLNNEGVWYDNRLFLLQNKENGDSLNEDRKNILILNEEGWSVLN